MTTQESFFDLFLVRLDKAYKTLDTYLMEPTEETIHDVRVTSRRLEAAYSVLPKSSRTKRLSRLILAYGKLFSANSTIRDHDIILKKLKAYGFDQESRILLLITKKKLKRLSKALDLAEEIAQMKKPKIKKSKATYDKFQKRLLVLIDNYNDSINTVLNGKSNMNELHAMRKTTKKLRYVMEMNTDDRYDKMVAILKSLQDILGDIRDCGVFIKYMKKHSKVVPNVHEILNFEKDVRDSAHKKMMQALERL